MVAVVAGPCKSIQAGVPWIFETARELAKATRGGGIKDAVFVAAWRWIEEEPLDALLEPPGRALPGMSAFQAKDEPVYAGDFSSGKADIQRWCRVLGKLASFLNFNAVASACFLLERRVEHGARAELLGLITEIKGVGRVRARMLHDAGFATVQAVAGADPLELHEKTLLPLEACGRIVKAASGAIDAGMQDDGGGMDDGE